MGSMIQWVIWTSALPRLLNRSTRFVACWTVVRVAGLVALFAASGLQSVHAGTLYVDPSATTSDGVGSRSQPFRRWSAVVIRSGNTYLQKRGTVSYEPVLMAGVSDVVIGAYGAGDAPRIVGQQSVQYGVKITSSTNVTVQDLQISDVTQACIHVLGSADYRVVGNECFQARYGVTVNVGERGPKGTIENNTIHDVLGDGIGAWDLVPGAVIARNHVYNFGNDGIDILGSVGAVVQGNLVHDSLDSDKIGFRGQHHVGIKAGGNRGSGGGRNHIRSNTVYRVKNYGISNRNATENYYVDNTCYDNGVNYSFVSDDGPSRAWVEGNESRHAFGGLGYDVYLPRPEALLYLDNNRWFGATINVEGSGRFPDAGAYQRAMRPYEQSTQF